MGEKKRIKKIVLVAVILLFVCVFGAVKLFEHINFLHHRNELCSYGYEVKTQYNSEQVCFKAILDLKNTRDKNYDSITKLGLDDNEEKEIRDFNDEKFNELATSVLNNTTVELEFSDDEIIKTFMDDGAKICELGKDENYNMPQYGFSSFLTFFRGEHYGVFDDIKYEYDCVYYICNILYPKIFTQGIIDTFRSIGIVNGATRDDELLAETISYISSSPEGMETYEEYIAVAKKRLAEQKAIVEKEPKKEPIKITMKCIECGAGASRSYKSPFSGQTEWYCYTHYNELQDLLKQFGMD